VAPRWCDARGGIFGGTTLGNPINNWGVHDPERKRKAATSPRLQAFGKLRVGSPTCIPQRAGLAAASRATSRTTMTSSSNCCQPTACRGPTASGRGAYGQGGAEPIGQLDGYDSPRAWPTTERLAGRSPPRFTAMSIGGPVDCLARCSGTAEAQPPQNYRVQIVTDAQEAVGTELACPW
jgi:hypothetical protein